MSKCMTLTSGICRGCRDNVGGIKAFYAANIQDVNGITFTNGIVTAIDCDTWYFFEPNKHSSNWSDTENVSIENGTNYYEQSINVLFGKYEQAVRDTLEELASAEMIIVVKDSNNKMWLLGDKDNGMILTAGNSNSGTAYGDFNGVNLTFSRFCKTPAVEVQLDDDRNLRKSMVPCGYPGEPNYIRYRTITPITSEAYAAFVKDNTNADKNTSREVSETGRVVSVYQGEDLWYTIYLFTDNNGNPIITDGVDLCKAVPVMSEYADSIVGIHFSNDTLTIKYKTYDDDFYEFELTDFLSAQPGVTYTLSDEYTSWSYDNNFTGHEVKLQLLDGDVNINNSTFESSEIYEIEFNTENIKSIGSQAFYYCFGLSSIEIPDTVTTINANAFTQCKGLSSIEIPDGATLSGYGIVSGCYNLKQITLPDGITSINEGMFASCYGLETLVVPDTVTSIGSRAFSSCRGLTSIELPSGVTSIGEWTFNECFELSTVTCHAVTPPTLGYNALIDIHNGTLYVPANSVSAYQANSAWSNAFTTITAIQ